MSQNCSSQWRVIHPPIGPLRIAVAEGKICQIDFHWEESLAEAVDNREEPLLKTVEQRLEAYFQSPIALQSIPHQPVGTPFQREVWQALCEIPLGEVLTYGALAKKLGSSPRAVGGACRNNPIPLIIPCHRVVSKSGIGGFSGQWGAGERVNVKQWLLRHEGHLSLF
ncbi:MAG: methylated-DNA--[protein]-cysteine S-methyltransferase [Gammaproteobacteria bacterium]|jgi:methylated-DNA-[protein]-cysteine S-methyltransferase|nr:methylated-DNA--[protein]-cysteine S-methyltransferase [Gammaproteobacteria bacterium]MBT4605462.1 methylated-DNA--[protein]-cysteine S-methyltransferase [Thiotrichales bacterium]MBT3473391.1 methylated-DNA--[protein]-cysteine S-methyltransferase [Gammaproteobacteria bacterium]MBT3967448.1 methylated-DNA--[protein]-cysteine S-methyltransferase [Gammaproteobacteria bacterium]MBT4080850.1 methylated-DNA--[protein]-cysteine S-methyltransferase [Gammaproteobacteria bacterium]